MVTTLNKEVTTLHKNEILRDCSLSIMEVALVWEMLLASRKTIILTEVATKCAKNQTLKEMLSQRLDDLHAQTTDLETIIKRAGFPVPFARPLHIAKMLFIDDTMIAQEMLASIKQRIGSLSYLIRSSLTNSALRMLSACFMATEMQLLITFCSSQQQEAIL